MTLTAQYRPYRDEECPDGDHIGWPSEHEPSIQIYEKTTETMPYAHVYRKKSLIWILSFSALVGIFGFIIGYFSHSTTHSSHECIRNKVISSFDSTISDQINHEPDSIIRARLLASISSENIRQHARTFSNGPHLASSPEDLNLAIKILDFFKTNHFDRTVLKNYSSLLSLPDSNRPNFVSLLDESGREVYTSTKSNKQPFFSPYSPKADVTGEILFVNYGRPVDYLQLQHHYNNQDIFSGKIFLVKQFHISASEQYKYAVAMNASALLLYPDPEHYNPLNEKPYPDSIWLPTDGVRNDAIFWNGAGDPETFGLPSTPYVFRNKFNDQVTIPAQPISMETAYEIFKYLDGPQAPATWKGGFNLTYKLGPNMKDNLKIRLSVNNRLVRKTIYNVIGTIRGSIEPDRYVIIGNQRDSMSNGAIDSATGVGTFLEMARVFGNMVANGWRPRRSILFCSWGAEEYNLIGSTEFVEDTFKILYMRAVAYINVNLVVNGNDTLSVAASPLLYHTIFNATKDVFLPKNNGPNDPDGMNEYNSIYDKWIVNMPKMRNTSTLLFQTTIFNNLNNYGVQEKITEKEMQQDRHLFHLKETNEQGSILKTYMESAFQEVRPHIRPLDVYGSYAPFYIMAGIPVVDICFISIDPQDKTSRNEEENEDFEKISFNHLPYPLLHTQYDRIDAVENFVDPKYKYHVTVGQLLTHIVERLSDSLFLPFNIFDYAQVLKDFYLKTIHLHSIMIGQQHQQQNKKQEENGDDNKISSTTSPSTITTDDATKSLIDIMDIDLKPLESAIKNFTQAAIKFHARQDKINSKDPMIVRQINDKLLLVERQFLDYRGIPSNNLKRHLILSPTDSHTKHEDGLLFPALLEEMEQIMVTEWKDEYTENSIVRLQKHLPILVNTIQSAAESLSFSGIFY